MQNTAVQNIVASITNQLKADVEIFDVYNTAPPDANDPFGLKNPQYTYTSLGKIASGKTADIQTIHFSSMLLATVNGKITGLDDNYYCNFPVSVMSVNPLTNATTFTITADDQTGLCQALQFIKYTIANPNSVLMKNFMIALKAKDQIKTVDAFFAATGSFKLCTFQFWAAIVSYLNNYTSPWQGGYYFYTVPQSSTDVVNLRAILNITSDATSDSAVMTMANVDNTIPTSNAETTSIKANSDGTFSETNVGTGNISVSVTALWMNVISTDPVTKNTRYLIGPAFTGTINGVKVLGTQTMRELPKSAAGQMSAKDKAAAEAQREKEFDRTWSKVATVVGLAVNAIMLIVMVKQMKAGEGAKKAKVENDAAEKGNVNEAEVEQQQAEVDQQYQAEVDSTLAPEVDKVNTELANLPAAEAELSTATKTNATEEVLDSQVEQLSEVLEAEPPTDALEATAESLYSAKQDLADGKIEEAQSTLKETSTQVESALNDAGSQAEQYETDALNEVKDSINEYNEQQQKVEEAQAEQEKQSEADPSEDMDPDTFDDPTSDPIEDFPIGGGE